MVNNDSDLKNILGAYTVLTPDEKKKAEAVSCARSVYLKQRVTAPCKLWQQLKIQLTYAPRLFWAASFIYILIVFCMSFGSEPELGLIAAATAPLLVTLTAPFVQRNIYGDMRELEASCKYNTRRLYSGGMLLGGIFDMAALFISTALFSAVSGTQFVRIWLLSLMFFCTSSFISLLISAWFKTWMGNIFGVFYSAVSIGAISAYSEYFIRLFSKIPTFNLVLGGVISALSVYFAFKRDIKKLKKGARSNEIRA